MARVSEFFLCYHRTQSLATMKEPLDLTYMTTCIFRYVPYTNLSNYINWLNKVESQNGQFWKDQGLFDPSQLYKVGPT